MADNFNSIGVKTETDADVVVAISDGVNTAGVTAGGRLEVDATFGGTQDTNLIEIAGTAVTAGAGAAGAGTQRVTIATDDVVSIDDNGGSITVDGTVTANAGTGPFPVSDNGGSITVDDGGVPLSIDDNGGSITVDGPLTDAELRATAVPVSGTVEVTNDAGNPLPISATTSVNAAANPLYARLTDGAAAISHANPLPVTMEGAGDGTLVPDAPATSTNVAAGATATFDSAIIGGTTGKLLHVAVASSQPVRIDIGTYDGVSVFTNKTIVFQPAYNTKPWTTPDRDWITYTADAAGVFRVRVTNLDNNTASDIHCSMLHEEV